MKPSPEHNERIAKMVFASFYPHFVSRILKNGRTEGEPHQVLEWLRGFDSKKLKELLAQKVRVEEFYKQAKIHPNAHMIQGMICGYKIEEIDNEITRKARYMDKLVDELAKGRKMEKILREEKT